MQAQRQLSHNKFKAGLKSQVTWVGAKNQGKSWLSCKKQLTAKSQESNELELNRSEKKSGKNVYPFEATAEKTFRSWFKVTYSLAETERLRTI